jgi:hypothetical protein
MNLNLDNLLLMEHHNSSACDASNPGIKAAKPSLGSGITAPPPVPQASKLWYRRFAQKS